jgi:heat shock protein HslJ
MPMRTGLVALVAAAATLVAACAPGAGSGGQLDGTEWILRSYLQDGSLALVPETQYADADFETARVRGFGGCNTYDAVYRAGGRTLFVAQPAATLMACDEESMTLEAAYLGLLGESRFYSARRDTLTIFDGNRATILVFDAAPRNPLLGNWRVDSFESAPATVSAVAEGTEIEVVFGIGSVGGNGGCHTFSGTYGTNGTVVRVGRLATTQKACADEVMTRRPRSGRPRGHLADRPAGAVAQPHGPVRLAQGRARAARREAAASPATARGVGGADRSRRRSHREADPTPTPKPHPRRRRLPLRRPPRRPRPRPPRRPRSRPPSRPASW